ncbi:MAG: methylmalonyl Co-A mutase-associated GTPase MeaB [Actinomycetia bacterium]|nr:methylmalonyl Co-A mutase-associated GTPase MeaB [Actinomycetes bacterium]MCP5033985.1 methylmalonyl Co-A mutase-associated GTPase MeaB [Actinomycetes bacterium]
MKPQLSPWARKLVNGDRRTLARSITKIESTRQDDQESAEALIDEVMSHTGGSLRLGITGTPGVGKSTLIDAFGSLLIKHGHRVAVLAVDPSSQRAGGSILGDKTRMTTLSNRPEAFIRPSPSRGLTGGVARHTRDALLLCEAAGHDIVIVETMGVGQAETAVADICDLFLLLVAPSGGDDLQGIKRGVMELADVVVVNKADGQLLGAAEHTAAEYRNALHLMRPKWPHHPTPIMTCSALTNEGLDELWTTISELHTILGAAGRIAALRANQAVAQLNNEFEYLLLERVTRLPAFEKYRKQVETSVLDGKRAPASAANELARRAWRELS